MKLKAYLDFSSFSLGYSSKLSDKTEKWKQVTEVKLLSVEVRKHISVKVFVAAGEMDWHDMEVIILHCIFSHRL